MTTQVLNSRTVNKTMNKTKLSFLILLLVGLVAPFAIYPVFLMKVLCFALFACAIT